MMPELSNAVDGARSLLGWELIHHTPAGDIGGIIIGTEAYAQEDEASHSFRGVTKRTAPMFEEAGTLYMYFIYGMHWCLNIVTGPADRGEAILIRALKPTVGIEKMQANRSLSDIKRLTNGPGSVVKALAIPSIYSGQKLNTTMLELIPPKKPIVKILTTPRVGIKKATDKPWRFYIQ